MRETQQLLPQSSQTRVVHSRKQKQTKDKNGCEAARKERESWTDNSGGVHWDFLFFSSNIHLCFYSSKHRWHMQKVDGPGHEVWWCWLKGSQVVGDSAADLWGLLRTMKSSAQGGKGLCKNLSVCNLSSNHSPTDLFLHTDLWAGYQTWFRWNGRYSW